MRFIRSFLLAVVVFFIAFSPLHASDDDRDSLRIDYGDKGAVEKTRERIAAYREGGIEQVSQNILEYTRSQPKPALLIAASVGIFIGVLVASKK